MKLKWLAKVDGSKAANFLVAHEVVSTTRVNQPPFDRRPIVHLLSCGRKDAPDIGGGKKTVRSGF